MVDHVFAAGSDTFLNNGRRFLQLRGAVVPPRSARVTSIETYLKRLKALPAAQKPVDKIQIVCHAGLAGYLAIDLDAEPPAAQQIINTNPAELIEALASGSVVIDATVIGPNTQFHIRGCEVGANTSFLQLLKDAMGGAVPVTAPKHFDNYLPVENGSRLGGMFEWFNYVFLIRRPTRFADRAAALAQFVAQSASFTFLDGTPVPAASWDAWLPLDTSQIWGYRGYDIMIARRDNVVPLGQTLLGQTHIPADTHFLHWERRVVNKLPNLKATDPETPANPRLDTEADMRTFAKAELPKQARFTAAYRLPVYEEYGFASLNDMVDGLSWTVEVTDADKGARRLVGTQFEYTVGPPVLDPAGNLYFNFERGPHAPAATTTITNVVETDARFFGTV